MNENEFNALIEEIGPERLLMLIKMISSMSQQDLSALVQALQQILQGQQQGQPAQPSTATAGPQPEQQRAANLYG